MHRTIIAALLIASPAAAKTIADAGQSAKVKWVMTRGKVID